MFMRHAYHEYNSRKWDYTCL